MKRTTWTVAYRLGTPESFCWFQSRPYTKQQEAETIRDKHISAGDLAFVYLTAQLDVLGLPKTFDVFTLCQAA